MGNRPAIEAGDQPCLSRARTIVCSRGERSTASFLGPLPRGGGLLVGRGGPVAVAAAVAGDLPGDDRRITTDSSGDLLCTAGLRPARGRSPPGRAWSTSCARRDPVPAKHQDQVLRSAELKMISPTGIAYVSRLPPMRPVSWQAPTPLSR